MGKHPGDSQNAEPNAELGVPSLARSLAGPVLAHVRTLRVRLRVSERVRGPQVQQLTVRHRSQCTIPTSGGATGFFS